MTGHRPMRPHPKEPQNRLSPEQIRVLQDEADAQAREVLGHIYQAMLKTPEFTLQNGMKCRVYPLYAPELDASGDLKCGFDVLTKDGHLEFTVGRTGWGKSFVQAEEQRAQRKASGRPPR
jgi:hypothetical protein